MPILSGDRHTGLGGLGDRPALLGSGIPLLIVVTKGGLPLATSRWVGEGDLGDCAVALGDMEATLEDAAAALGDAPPAVQETDLEDAFAGAEAGRGGSIPPVGKTAVAFLTASLGDEAAAFDIVADALPVAAPGGSTALPPLAERLGWQACDTLPRCSLSTVWAVLAVLGRAAVLLWPFGRPVVLLAGFLRPAPTDSFAPCPVRGALGLALTLPLVHLPACPLVLSAACLAAPSTMFKTAWECDGSVIAAATDAAVAVLAW